MIYRLLPVFALLALIIGVVVLSGPQRESPTAAAVTEEVRDPGYAARNARLIQTGPDGTPLYTLDAAQIHQQPDEGTVDMQQVQLGFRDPSGNQWTAHAAHGELAQGSGVVELDGNVHVAGILPGSNEPAEMISEHLSYDSSAQTVATRDPVTLVMSGRQLNSIGLVASLKERHVQLESAVHGSFQP
ncbi:MAG: LPS export ABC transporter periplasmic protein LptC [Steroidobacterales bacterium]|jgi:LPS export ABC transporter protein LptC